MGAKSGIPNLKAEDVYSYVATKTDLSFNQVKQCFIAYADMLEDIAINKYTDKDLTIPLPHVGNFYFVKHTGRKSGSTYSFFKEPKVKGSKKITLEKNEPSYYHLKLKVGKKIRDSVKKHTMFYE